MALVGDSAAESCLHKTFILGRNDAHHVVGVENFISTTGVPINTTTFTPISAGPLIGAAGQFDTRVPSSLVPKFSHALGAKQEKSLSPFARI
jgi:hypothetical protein